MPENTICVDRTTKWGNPFVVSATMTRVEAVRLFRAMLGGYVCVSAVIKPGVQEAYQDRLSQIGELRGNNLACWCRLDQECHADILLELANGA